MKTGVIVYSDDSETVWNAFRFGNFSLTMGDEVSVFLIGKGVEYGSLDTGTFNISEQAQTFIDGGGKMFACGTCLNIHQLKVPEIFIVATLNDLREIVKESDRIVTF